MRKARSTQLVVLHAWSIRICYINFVQNLIRVMCKDNFFNLSTRGAGNDRIYTRLSLSQNFSKKCGSYSSLRHRSERGAAG